MGERAKSLGEEAETKIWNLLGSLQYKIEKVNDEEYDIDCIADSPPKNPKYGLAKPRYAPEGLTAFEVTEQTFRKRKIERFRKKILKYNRENTEKLKGGVFIVDRRSTTNMLDFMRRRQIWGWGNVRQTLYQKKIDAFNFWKKKGFTTEIPIDATTSYLRCSTPPPVKSKQLLHLSVFFDDHVHKLSPIKVRQVMNKIKTNSMLPLLKLGIRPIYASFRFYSIGGKSERLREEIYTTVIEPWKNEQIIVITDRQPFEDYRAFHPIPSVTTP